MDLRSVLFLVGTVTLLFGSFIPGSAHLLALVGGVLLVAISMAMGSNETTEQLPRAQQLPHGG